MADKPRPVGDAGRGKHTGKAGPLGGKHRDNSGCVGMKALTKLHIALLRLVNAI